MYTYFSVNLLKFAYFAQFLGQVLTELVAKLDSEYEYVCESENKY